jgi:hypothetical protein
MHFKIGKIVVKTVPYSVNVNVKSTFRSHIDKQIFLTFFLTSLSLCIFTIWKCIAYNRFCRDGIYFDKILVSEYKLSKRSNKVNLFIALPKSAFDIYIHWIWYCFDNYFTYFFHVFKYCYSDSRRLWAVMRAGGLAL